MSQLTLVTLNLRRTADSWLRRREQLVAQLIDTEADLIAVQEVAMLIGQGRWLRNQINYRLSGSAQQPYQLAVSRRTDLFHGLVEGVGILSRLPIIAHDRLALAAGRVAARANVLLPSGETLDLVTVDLHGAAAEPEVREEQVNELIGWLYDRNPVAHQVIAGTFHEEPTGAAIRRMKQVYRSVFAEANGREPLATFPTALHETAGQGVCHDYIFVSKAMRRVLNARLCCHRPDATDDRLFPSAHVGIWTCLDVGDA